MKNPKKNLIILFIAFFSIHIEAQELAVMPSGRPQPEITAEISSWDSKSANGSISVFYDFPKGYHQVDSVQYFKIAVKPDTDKIIFGSQLKDTSAPIVDGLKEFKGKTVIVIEFHYSGTDKESSKIDITAHYQMCSDEGACLFPEEKDISIIFNPSMPDKKPKGLTLKVLNLMNQDTEEASYRTSFQDYSLVYILMAFIGGILV